MYEVSTQGRFSAAHRLEGYPGSCASCHGHNWEVEVFVQGERLNETGILVDFRDIKAALGEVLEELDHADLNTIPAFKEQNPTSEHLARYLYGRLREKVATAGGRLDRVSVYETPETRATYWEAQSTHD